MDWLVWNQRSGGRTRVLWRMSVIWTWSIGRIDYAGFCGSWRGIRGSEFDICALHDWHWRADIPVCSFNAIAFYLDIAGKFLILQKCCSKNGVLTAIQICWPKKDTKSLCMHMAQRLANWASKAKKTKDERLIDKTTRSILHSPPRHSNHHSRQESTIAKQHINSPLICSNACLHNLAAQDCNNETIKIRTPKSPTENQDTKVELTQVPASMSDKIATKNCTSVTNTSRQDSRSHTK